MSYNNRRCVVGLNLNSLSSHEDFAGSRRSGAVNRAGAYHHEVSLWQPQRCAEHTKKQR